MATLDDLRAAFQDLADEAPTTCRSGRQTAGTSTTPLDLVGDEPGAGIWTRRGKTALAGALAVAAALLAAIIALPLVLTRDQRPATDSSGGVCAGVVSICVTGFGTPWSVTLRLDGRLAPPIGSGTFPPPGPVRLVAGASMSFALTIRHDPAIPLHDVYLFAYAGSFTDHSPRPSGPVSVIAHHAGILPVGRMLTGSWTATPIGADRHLDVGVSFGLGNSDREVDITELDIAHRTSGSVTVPDVVGRSLKQAQSALRSKGLAVVLGGSEHLSSVPKGMVAAETPAAGSSVARGSTVAVSLSEGP